jgi:hypothetical protein
MGPLVAGFLVEHLGFAVAFDVFAFLAALAAALFIVFMPETRPPSSPLCQVSTARRSPGIACCKPKGVLSWKQASA